MKIVERPGQSGDKKQKMIDSWNSKYGVGKWAKRWYFDGKLLAQQDVFKICEEAYYQDSLGRPEVWRKLCLQAKDVYDLCTEEIESGCDYTKQLDYTRFHDICIRNVVKRRGWTLDGSEVVQIRWDALHPNWDSENFDPGKVRFHNPDLITNPRLESWWDEDSVEDFYQSNKVIVLL